MNLVRLCVLLVAMSCVYAQGLWAQAVGSLDLSFGDHGRVSLPHGTHPSNEQRLAVQADGKILLLGAEFTKEGGGFMLYRYSSLGLLDSSFGKQGKISLALEGEARDIVLQKDGKILLAGYISKSRDKDFVVVRLLPNGQADEAFGDAGKAIINLGGTDEGRRLLLRPDGKILVAGNSFAQSWVQRDFAVVQLLADGQLDQEFGNGGIQRIDIGKYDFLRGMALQPDGKLLLAGYAKLNTFYDFAIIRLGKFGRMDTSFAQEGLALFHHGWVDDFCEDISLQADGYILVYGHARMKQDRPEFDLMVMRMAPDGQLDHSFGQAGIVRWDLGGTEYASRLMLQSDGGILLTGTANYRPSLLRLTPSGRPDLSFGEKGWRLLQTTGNSRNRISDMALSPTERIILAGQDEQGAHLLRFHSNPFLPGLAEVQRFNETLLPENLICQVDLNPAAWFRIRGWAAGAFIPSPKAYPAVADRATQNLDPITSEIAHFASFQIGESYRLLVLQDELDRLHLYINGRFARTLAAETPKLLKPIITEASQKPLLLRVDKK